MVFVSLSFLLAHKSIIYDFCAVFHFYPLTIIDKITDVLKSLEKQTSVNSVKNGRRLTLPDRDSTNVIKRLLSENNKLDFDERVQYDFVRVLLVS